MIVTGDQRGTFSDFALWSWRTCSANALLIEGCDSFPNFLPHAEHSFFPRRVKR
jgi:hypothetical protein